MHIGTNLPTLAGGSVPIRRAGFRVVGAPGPTKD